MLRQAHAVPCRVSRRCWSTGCRGTTRSAAATTSDWSCSTAARFTSTMASRRRRASRRRCEICARSRRRCISTCRKDSRCSRITCARTRSCATRSTGDLRAYFFAGASLAQHTWDALDAASTQERGVKVPMLSGSRRHGDRPVGDVHDARRWARSGVIGLPAAGNSRQARAGRQTSSRSACAVPNVTPGYWRQPELTAAAFDEEGFYRLGDAVRLIDPERSDPRPEVRRAHRRGLQARERHLGQRRAVARELIGALSPVAQDVVIAGLDADFVAVLVIPDRRRLRRDVVDCTRTPTRAELAGDPQILAESAAAPRRACAREPGQQRAACAGAACCRSRRRSIAARSRTRARSISARYLRTTRIS